MNLDEFSQLVKYKDREQGVSSHFDEHLALYSLLYAKFSDLIIELKEDKHKCCYILKAINDADIKYMVEFYNDLPINFFSRKFIIEATMVKNSIHIIFKDKEV